jgi:hypothetical protein
MVEWTDSMLYAALLVGGAAVAIVLALGRWWDRRDRRADLGTVSDQWVAEQRLGPRDRDNG